MITLKFISEDELKAMAKEDNHGLYAITGDELAEFCADGGNTYAMIRYDGEMSDFITDAAFLSPAIVEGAFLPPGIAEAVAFNPGEGYTLPNICTIHVVFSIIFDFDAADSLMFYNEDKKYAFIILHSKERN